MDLIFTPIALIVGYSLGVVSVCLMNQKVIEKRNIFIKPKTEIVEYKEEVDNLESWNS